MQDSLAALLAALKELLGSASKLVFLAITVTVCVAFLNGKLDSKDFMALALMVFTFYFSNKGDNNQKFLGK